MGVHLVGGDLYLLESELSVEPPPQPGSWGKRSEWLGRQQKENRGQKKVE